MHAYMSNMHDMLSVPCCTCMHVHVHYHACTQKLLAVHVSNISIINVHASRFVKDHDFSHAAIHAVHVHVMWW